MSSNVKAKKKELVKEENFLQLSPSDIPYPGFPLAVAGDYIKVENDGFECWIPEDNWNGQYGEVT